MYLKKELINNLNRQSNYMKNKKMFNHNILRINENETLFINHREIATTMKTMKNKKEQFSIHYEKLQISKKYIDEYIKKHHNKLLQNHSRISKTL